MRGGVSLGSRLKVYPWRLTVSLLHGRHPQRLTLQRCPQTGVYNPPHFSQNRSVHPQQWGPGPLKYHISGRLDGTVAFGSHPDLGVRSSSAGSLLEIRSLPLPLPLPHPVLSL